MLVMGERSSWETFATKLRRDSSRLDSSPAMRLMELPSCSSSPPQCSSTRRERSPLVNSRTALSISRMGSVWLRAMKNASSTPSSIDAAMGSAAWGSTEIRLTRSRSLGMCSSTAPTTRPSE